MHMAPLSQTFLELLPCQEHCHTASASIHPYTCTGEPQDTEDSPVLPQGEEGVPVVQLGRRRFLHHNLGTGCCTAACAPPKGSTPQGHTSPPSCMHLLTQHSPVLPQGEKGVPIVQLGRRRFVDEHLQGKNLHCCTCTCTF